jgi:Flp pilus assembly protein TadD
VGGLATLTGNSGDLAGAIALFDRAATLAPERVDYAYAAAQISLALGNGDEAEGRLRDIVRTDPGHAGARNDLAWILAERGAELDFALALAEEARRRDESAATLDTLGWVHLKRGEADKAVAVLEKAVELKPDDPSIRYRLGVALREAGDEERARATLKGALGAGAFPEAGDARRELAQLEQP